MKFPNLARIVKTAFVPQRIAPPYSHAVQIGMTQVFPIKRVLTSQHSKFNISFFTGDPVLRTKCTEIPVETIKSNEVQALVNHMITTMRQFNCVGLACNQIGL